MPIEMSPFKSQAQKGWMYANKPAMAKRWQADTPKGESLPEKVHHSGKGTRARLNSVAEKKFFGSRYSK